MYVAVANILKGGVDGGKLEGAAVLQKEAVRLVHGGVFTHLYAVVHRHLG